MSTNRSYRVSDEFLQKMDQVKKYYQEDLKINLSNEEIFDEMIDMYYAVIFLKTNSAVSRLVKNEITAALEQFTIMNAKFHNAVLEELKKQGGHN